MLLPFLSLAGRYASEGRPYALTLGAAAASLLFWQRSGESGRSRRWNLLGMGVAAGCAVAFHYYGFLTVFPLLAGEAVRWRERRRASVAVPLTLAVSLLPLPLALVFAPVLRPPNLVFWGRVHLDTLPTTYAELLSSLAWWACLSLGVAVSIMVLRPARDESPAPARPFPDHARMALAGYLLLPCAGICVGILAGGFATRYVIAGTIGMSAVFACLVPRRSSILVTVLAIAGWTACFSLARPMVPRLRPSLTGPFLPRTEPERPHVPAAALPGEMEIVIQDIHTFFETHFYSPPDVARRLHFLTDAALAMRWTNDNSFPYLARAAAKACRCEVGDYRAFLAVHPRFVVVARQDDSHPWIVAQLAQEGAELRVRSAAGGETVYQVTMPGR
jgi:hypothetical protein